MDNLFQYNKKTDEFIYDLDGKKLTLKSKPVEQSIQDAIDVGIHITEIGEALDGRASLPNDKTALSNKIQCNPLTYGDGYYFITSNVSFAIARKPIWIHRAFTRLLLGWKWKDNV